MTFRELVQKYQRFDVATGQFTAQRSLRQYAAMLGVAPMMLSRFFNGVTTNSPTILAAFLRTFPSAGTEVLAALATPASPPATDEDTFPDIPYLATA